MMTHEQLNKILRPIVKIMYVYGLPCLIIGIDYCLYKLNKWEEIQHSPTLIGVVGGIHVIGILVFLLMTFFTFKHPLNPFKNA